jgi:hypothetical protein
MMFKPLLTASLLTLSLLSQARAQVTLADRELPVPYSANRSIRGFQPSLLASEESAKNLYNMMPTSIFTRRSGCYQRAHYWSHELFSNIGIRSMKIFLFFTDRYRREFDYQWSFHVAPLIPVRLADGSVEERVFDPVFVSPPSWVRPEDIKRFDSRPISIAQWTRYFIFPKTECPLIETYEEYLNHQELNYCFVMKTPMFNYSPIDFERDRTGQSGSIGSSWYDPGLRIRTSWRPGDLENMMKGLKGD